MLILQIKHRLSELNLAFCLCCAISLKVKVGAFNNKKLCLLLSLFFITRTQKDRFWNITHIVLVCKGDVTDEQRWGWETGRVARLSQWSVESVQDNNRTEEKQNYWEMRQTGKTLADFQSELCSQCKYLVSSAVCDVFPEQEIELTEKPHRFQVRPGYASLFKLRLKVFATSTSSRFCHSWIFQSFWNTVNRKNYKTNWAKIVINKKKRFFSPQ